MNNEEINYINNKNIIEKNEIGNNKELNKKKNIKLQEKPDICLIEDKKNLC